MTSFNLTEHLRRRIASGTWIPELDGLRFIAIASVVLFHLRGQIHHHNASLVLSPGYALLDRSFNLGNRGVQLFFIVSGFILARPFAQHHLFDQPAPSLAKYFQRRLTRLEPPLIFNLLVLALSILLVEHRKASFILPHLLASIFYVHYFFFHHSSLINFATWSLEVEVQFYILAPLLCLLFAIRRPTLRRLFITALMVASFLVQTALGLTAFTLAGELQYFLAGLLFADLFLTTMPALKPRKTWDVVSLIGWPLLFLAGRSFEGLWLPFAALILFIAAFRGTIFPIFLRNRWIALTGGMCYTIYLWHAPVMTVIERLLDKLPFLAPRDYLLLSVVQGAVKVAAIALVSLVLFILIERPCMDPRWPQELMQFLRGHRLPHTQTDDNLDPVNQVTAEPVVAEQAFPVPPLLQEGSHD